MKSNGLQSLIAVATAVALTPFLVGDLLIDSAAYAHASRVGPPKVTPQTPPPTPRVRIPGQTPNIIDRVRARIPGADLGVTGESRNDGSILSDQDRIDAELDAVIDEIMEAINPVQAADRSILDEYLDAAARPENKDKTPDELMEEAVRTTMERILSDLDDEDEFSEAELDFWTESTTDNIMGDMREGESPVLDSRPGGMSQQEWDAHLDRREQIYKDKYQAELGQNPGFNPEIRPLPDSNGDKFVTEARAAANVPFGSEIGAGGRNDRSWYTMTSSDPYGGKTSSRHTTRDTEVIIVNQNGQETGIKVTFRRHGAYSGQQPVVYGQDPTVDSKMVEYVDWAIVFNTNNQRLFGRD